MLERSSLLVQSWRPGPGLSTGALRSGAEKNRPVRDADSHEILGQVREPTQGRRGLWSWLGGRNLQVCETEDASLIFTLQRGLWRGWEVIDAEESLVGAVQRRTLLNEQGSLLAFVEGGRGAGQFRTTDQELLATWQFLERDHYRLNFAVGPANNPFVRMVLLAAVLTW
jgi:hypothetical protein